MTNSSDQLTQAAFDARSLIDQLGGYFEEKMIPDKKTGKLYGPYLYLRWMEGKVRRSIYLGKVQHEQVVP